MPRRLFLVKRLRASNLHAKSQPSSLLEWKVLVHELFSDNWMKWICFTNRCEQLQNRVFPEFINNAGMNAGNSVYIHELSVSRLSFSKRVCVNTKLSKFGTLNWVCNLSSNLARDSLMKLLIKLTLIDVDFPFVFLQVSQCVRKKEEPYRNLRRGCRTVSADCVSTIIRSFPCLVNFVGSVAVACPQITHELFKKQFYQAELKASADKSQQQITAAIFCVLIGKTLICRCLANLELTLATSTAICLNPRKHSSLQSEIYCDRLHKTRLIRRKSVPIILKSSRNAMRT